jgi:hypothetical protein
MTTQPSDKIASFCPNPISFIETLVKEKREKRQYRPFHPLGKGHLCTIFNSHLNGCEITVFNDLTLKGLGRGAFKK